jgi:hypothetical protein
VSRRSSKLVLARVLINADSSALLMTETGRSSTLGAACVLKDCN